MNDIKKLLHSYKNLLVSGILIAGSIAGVLLVIWPVTQKVVQIRQDLLSIGKQNENLSQKIQILESVDETTYTNLYAELLRAVPSDQSLISLFSTIDGLGAASGVTVANFSLSRAGGIATDSAQMQSPEEKKVGSTTLAFGVKLTGTYAQIRDFFFQVTQVRRFVRVRSFDFSAADDGDTIAVNVLMDAFYAPYRTSLGSAETVIEPLTEKDSQIITAVSNMPLVAGVGSAINPGSQSTPTLENKENLFEP